MQPKNRIPSHPGAIQLREFLEPLGRTQVALAEHLGISVLRINEIVRGKRGITPVTAASRPDTRDRSRAIAQLASGT
jgi:addiction module HigA family antidote